MLMIGEIIEEVSRRAERNEGSRAEFGRKNYTALDFSERNYKSISEASGRTLIFSDGGN